MKQADYVILDNAPIAPGVFRMRLSGDTSAIARPGQFINIRLDGLFLRRPISVCDWDGDGLTIIYKVVGRGTAHMAKMHPGEVLDALSDRVLETAEAAAVAADEIKQGFDADADGKVSLDEVKVVADGVAAKAKEAVNGIAEKFSK